MAKSTLSTSTNNSSSVSDAGAEILNIIKDAVTDVLGRPEGRRGPYLIRNSDSAQFQKGRPPH